MFEIRTQDGTLVPSSVTHHRVRPGCALPEVICGASALLAESCQSYAETRMMMMLGVPLDSDCPCTATQLTLVIINGIENVVCGPDIHELREVIGLFRSILRDTEYPPVSIHRLRDLNTDGILG